MGGWMDGWIDGWMDVLMHKRIEIVMSDTNAKIILNSLIPVVQFLVLSILESILILYQTQNV